MKAIVFVGKGGERRLVLSTEVDMQSPTQRQELTLSDTLERILCKRALIHLSLLNIHMYRYNRYGL
jgi:hypothetical protein